jgi:hypothetical protein
MNLIKALDEALKKLETAKKQAKNVCNMNTEQGVADWASLMRHINYIEMQIYELMGKVVEAQREVRIDGVCAKLERQEKQ